MTVDVDSIHENSCTEVPTTPITATSSISPTPITADNEPAWLKVAKQAEQAIQNIPDGKKRLAIVGFAPTRSQAPYADPSWEIWGLNDLHRAIPRWTRWFDIHTLENIDTDVVAGRTSNAARKTNIPETALENMGISGLAKLQCPVYMQEKFPEVPWSVKLPLMEMLAFWKARGLTGYRYLTNSVSFMIAYALYEGVVTGHQWDEIDIFGVDMAVGDEYIAQRPSCEYWIGIAEGMGVRVYIPDASDLCKTAFIYAYEEKAQKAYEGKLSKIAADAQERIRAYSAQREELNRLIHHAEAQIGTVSDVKRVWSNLDSKLNI